MSNHNPESRRRYEEEQRYTERRDFQSGTAQEGYPRDQARYSQGGYSSDEYDTGGNQHTYGRSEANDYGRWSNRGWQQEQGNRYPQGTYGRSDMNPQQDDWRMGNPRHHEDYGRGGYAQPGQSGQWGGYGQSDYNRSGAAGQGQYGRGSMQGYGRQTGMGGTYEGEFGPEAGSRQFGTGQSEWGNRDAWSTPGPMTGRGPEGYQRSDERIKEDICERLTQHGQLDASKIRINVNDCEVTLEGSVDSRQAKRMAEDAVEGIAGVRDVHNQLRVHQQGWQQSTTNQSSESLPKGKDSMMNAGDQNKSAMSSTAGTTTGSQTNGKTSQTTRGGSRN